jgi:hypothetical protein
MDFLADDAVGMPGGVQVSAGVESRLMAQALAGLFTAGATLALMTVLLPHSTHANVVGLLAIVANAYLVGAVMFARARSLSPRLLPVLLAWGSTLITGVAYFSGESPSPLVFFYLWIFLYSSYFFTRRCRSSTWAWPTVGCCWPTRPPMGFRSGGLSAWARCWSPRS